MGLERTLVPAQLACSGWVHGTDATLGWVQGTGATLLTVLTLRAWHGLRLGLGLGLGLGVRG